MIQFVLGKSGSGKTHTLQSLIEERCKDERVTLFVPEQFTYETERILFKRLGATSFANLRVTSFSRFARDILREYGGCAKADATDPAKLITIELTLSSLAHELSIYQKSATAKSFPSLMLDTITELKNAGVSDADFLEIVQQIDTRSYLREKAEELAKIYAMYNKRLFATYNDPLDNITRASSKLLGKSYFSNQTVIIDEFKGFTANENAILKLIFSDAKDVFVSLCIAPDRYDSSGLSPFASVGETYKKLSRLAKEQGSKLAVPIKLYDQHKLKSKILSHMEQSLYSPHIKSFSEEQDGSVSAMLCRNEYDEVDYTVSTIASLVSEGYRYSDIAIIARNLESYLSKLVISSKKYGIPLYADIRTPITDMPLIRFVRHCFSVVLEGYNTDNILALLKCGALSYDLNSVAELENYAFVWDINKAQWNLEFTNCPRGFIAELTDDDSQTLERINPIRAEVVSALNEFSQAVNTADAKEISVAVLQIIEQLKVKQTIEADVARLAQADKLDLAQEQQRVWEILIELVDTIAAVASNEPITAKQYAKLYNLIAESYDKGGITQSIDCVTAGSADRIRISDKKVVFVLGANDNVLPFVPSEGGVFSDSEREQLIALDVQIGQPIKDKILEERFIAYKALTSPTERLYITASVATIDGKPIAPSQILGQLKKMFGEGIVSSTEMLGGEYYCKNLHTAFSELAKRYYEDTPLTATLRSILSDDPIYKAKLARLNEIATRDDISIKDKDIAGELFRKNMYTSPTGVEGYYQCSFKYFCDKGLKLRPLRRAELNPLETGTLIHKVVHSVTSTFDLKKPLRPALIKKKIKEELDLYIDEVMGGAKDKTSRFIYLYNRLRISIYKVIEHLHEELLQSAFEPTDFECEIDKDGEISPLVLTAQNDVTITVTGTVDRIDTYKNRKGEQFVRVIDYKSGKKQFSLSDVYSGLNLQMLIYLFCIQDTKGGKYDSSLPAGILYMPASDVEPSLDRDSNPSSIRDLKSKHYRMNGLILNDPDVIEAMDQSGGVYIPISRNKDGSLAKKSYESLASLAEMAHINKYIKSLIVRMAYELHEGKIPAYPTEGTCSYCDYSSVCRRTSSDKTKPSNSFSKEQVILQIQRDLEEEEQTYEQGKLY